MLCEVFCLRSGGTLFACLLATTLELSFGIDVVAVELRVGLAGAGGSAAEGAEEAEGAEGASYTLMEVLAF